MSKDMPWWDNPDRLCLGKPEYGDLDLVRSHVKRMLLARRCFDCPVFKECEADLIAMKKDHPHKGTIQAGRVGEP